MVDIHSHVLWGIDDGSQTLEESVEMARLSAASGVTDLVATPHANAQFRYEPRLIEERLALLQRECGPVPRLHRGCDFHVMAENIQDALARPARYTVNGGRYLLVELPDQVISGMMLPVFKRLIDAGFVPIITHPERNMVVRDHLDHLESWIQAGCLSQITAHSYLGLFGRRAEKSAWEMTEKGLAHFVASDAHDTQHRHPRLDEARSAVAKQYGEEWAERVFQENPAAVIENRELPAALDPAAGRKRSWTRFWKR